MSNKFKNFALTIGDKRPSSDLYNIFYSDIYINDRFKKKDIKEIQKIIDSNNLEEKRLLSETFFRQEGFYKRLLLHYANLFLYYNILIPISNDEQLIAPRNVKKYQKAIRYVNTIQKTFNFKKVVLKVLKQGCYFGLITKMSKNDFIVIDLPIKYCRYKFKDIFGNPLIDFDLRYFDSIAFEQDRESVLSAYPTDVQAAYYSYKETGKNKYYHVPAVYGIYLDLYGPIPSFLDIIPATLIYNETLILDQQKLKEEIKKILIQKIPHNNNNELLMEPDEAVELHSGAVEMLKNNPNIDIITTYADTTVASTNTTSEGSTNTVLDRTLNNIFAKAGATKQLFSTDGNLALDVSLKNDMNFMNPILTSIESIVNKIINAVFGNSVMSFSFKFLPITEFNRSEYIEDTLQAASLGYSILVPAIASGLSQDEFICLKTIENDVLKLTEKLKPLQSAYQGNNSGGAPEKDLKDKSEETIETIENKNK